MMKFYKYLKWIKTNLKYCSYSENIWNLFIRSFNKVQFIHCYALARRPRPYIGDNEKLQIKVILILPAKTTVRTTATNSTMPIHWHYLRTAMLQEWERVRLASHNAIAHCIFAFCTLHSHCIFASANARMNLTLELKLTVEPAFRNFYSSIFALPPPKAKRLELKLRMSKYEYTVQWQWIGVVLYILALILTRSLVAGKITLICNFPLPPICGHGGGELARTRNVLLARAGAKYTVRR